jgi:hypothetical protein
MTNPSPDIPTPALHTVVISDVPSMFWKLAWDIDQFDDIQRNDPDIFEPLAFAAINVCISATSLRDWVVLAYLANAGTMTKEKVMEHIHDHVPQQKTCGAIANTAKHSGFREGKWSGGSVRIDLDEPDEDFPGGLILRHVHANDASTNIALNEFMSLERNWWNELQNLGFTFPNIGPEWRQRRIRAKFGNPLLTSPSSNPTDS